MANWQDRLSVRRRGSMSDFGVVGEVTVPVPIGALLAVFAEPTLNPAWNERLAYQRLEKDASGRVVAHQVCWPHPTRTCQWPTPRPPAPPAALVLAALDPGGGIAAAFIHAALVPDLPHKPRSRRSGLLPIRCSVLTQPARAPAATTRPTCRSPPAIPSLPHHRRCTQCHGRWPIATSCSAATGRRPDHPPTSRSFLLPLTPSFPVAPPAPQVYPLLWPLADRDFVLSCRELIDEASLSFSSSCSSVTHPAFPEDPSVVRGRLVRSSWRFTAVPTGTTIRFESVIDPRGAIPKTIVQAAQRIGKDKLIASLVYTQRELGRPPHRRFERWADKAIAAGSNNGTTAGSREATIRRAAAAGRSLRSRLFAAVAGLASAARPAAVAVFTLPAAAVRLAIRAAGAPARAVQYGGCWLLDCGARANETRPNFGSILTSRLVIRAAGAPARAVQYGGGWLYCSGAYHGRRATQLLLRHLPGWPEPKPEGEEVGEAGAVRRHRVAREGLVGKGGSVASIAGLGEHLAAAFSPKRGALWAGELIHGRSFGGRAVPMRNSSSISGTLRADVGGGPAGNTGGGPLASGWEEGQALEWLAGAALITGCLGLLWRRNPTSILVASLSFYQDRSVEYERTSAQGRLSALITGCLDLLWKRNSTSRLPAHGRRSAQGRLSALDRTSFQGVPSSSALCSCITVALVAVWALAISLHAATKAVAAPKLALTR